jgi:DNA-directed RNA polymerase subunit beta'
MTFNFQILTFDQNKNQFLIANKSIVKTMMNTRNNNKDKNQTGP